MKKNLLHLAFVGAIALVGGVCFSACSDDKDDPGTSGTVISEVNVDAPEVNVDFVFNVSTGNEATTRMTAANTQATEAQAFRGIDHAALMAYSLKNTATPPALTDGKSVPSALTANKYYDMGDIMGQGTIDPDGGGTLTPQSRRVIELSLPVETNALMFWGKAKKTGTDNQQGSISWTLDKNIANNEFTLAKRIPTGSGPGEEDAFKQYESLIAALLTKIVQTSLTVSAESPVTYGTQSYTGTIAWSDYVQLKSGSTNEYEPRANSPVTTTQDMCALGEILAKAFASMNTIYTNEVRAGSGPTVAKMLGDLYVVIQAVASATPTNLNEAVSKEVATQIRTNIATIINNPDSNPQWITTLSALKTFSGLAATAVNLVTGDLNNFPANFNVPYGAATLKYTTSTNSYSYNQVIPTYAMNGAAGGSFDVLNYRYPAELCYFGNSPVRVTDDAHVTADYPDGVTNWNDDNSWAAGATGTGSVAWTKDGHVLSSTRSVAMQHNINYGTALLKTSVKYGAATLNDNNAAIQQARTGATEADATIDVASAGVFTLTGILIGGVEETVGWNYVAKAMTPTFSSFIYDNDLPSQAIPAYTAAGTYSEPNYTLVWDNWNPANKGAKQNVVYVALEFVNNTGKDFWGMNNLIRKGATFYLTGKLDPDKDYGTGSTLSTTDRSAGITWPTNYALPPYDTSGNTIKERRIFIQDYMTEAKFTIGPNSLQKALVAVPDLRSSQLSLGLSVDLSWSTGLSFEDVVLGN